MFTVTLNTGNVVSAGRLYVNMPLKPLEMAQDAFKSEKGMEVAPMSENLTSEALIEI